jgi:hypothetical protein
MAVMGAISGIVSGVTGMMTASYQAAVANMNAKVAEENAKRAEERGQIDAQIKDLESANLLGEQEVAQAASGISLSGKSQLATRNSARKLGRMDAGNILQDALVDAYNFRVQKANFKAEAAAAKISGISSLVGGVLSAVGSLPTGATSAASAPSLVGGSTSVTSPTKFGYPQPGLSSPGLLATYVKKKPMIWNRGML